MAASVTQRQELMAEPRSGGSLARKLGTELGWRRAGRNPRDDLHRHVNQWLQDSGPEPPAAQPVGYRSQGRYSYPKTRRWKSNRGTGMWCLRHQWWLGSRGAFCTSTRPAQATVVVCRGFVRGGLGPYIYIYIYIGGESGRTERGEQQPKLDSRRASAIPWCWIPISPRDGVVQSQLDRGLGPSPDGAAEKHVRYLLLALEADSRDRRPAVGETQ